MALDVRRTQIGEDCQSAIADEIAARHMAFKGL